MLSKSSLYILLALVVCCIHAFVLPTEKPRLPEQIGNKFYYFGYGSNMLTKRIHIQNPTAVKIGVGILKDYRLDFNTFTERWGGAPATIVPTQNNFVYGTVWLIDISNLDDIDDQEGVFEHFYYAASLPIIANETVITARAYIMVEQPKSELNKLPINDVPFERQPSKTYLQCLVKGAIETGIAPWYVNWLKSIKHNGHVAADLEELLELKDVELST